MEAVCMVVIVLFPVMLTGIGFAAMLARAEDEVAAETPDEAPPGWVSLV